MAHQVQKRLRWGASRLLLLALLSPQGIVEATPRDGDMVPLGSPSRDVLAVAVHPAQPAWVFAATPRAVYASLDHGDHWSERFQVPTQATVTGLAVNAAEPPTLLLATDQGLYGSPDGGTQWSRLFKGTGAAEQHCTDVVFHPQDRGRALLGTSGGLFVTSNQGQRWDPVRVPRAAREIRQLAWDLHQPDRLYVVSTRGLFVGGLHHGPWEQRVGVFDAEEAAVEESQQGETGNGGDSLHHLSAVAGSPPDPALRLTLMVYAVAVDPLTPSTLYLATSRGLQRSADGGISWRWLPRSGLTSPALSHLVLRQHSPLVIYAATGHGVARYAPEREQWETITRGLANTRVHELALSRTHIWAATPHGLYRYQVPLEPFGGTEPPTVQELLANFVHEPTIHQVQEAAIHYAEVHPDKIRRWRTQANLKALLPTVDVGFEEDNDWFISARGSTSSPSTDRFMVMRNPSRSFDISVKWDLGELIWNDDQTTIDVRSKLMVQLRDDIVDEVTRTYFERRRLQVNLLTEPADDRPALMETTLRIQELTALIDGLTGGWWSRSVELDPAPRD